MTDLSRRVANRLRDRRTALGWTQATLAEAAGVSTELVSRIERARCLPSLTTLVAFARALSTRPDDLLGFEPPSAGREIEAVTALMRAMPAARRREVRRIAEALAQYGQGGD